MSKFEAKKFLAYWLTICNKMVEDAIASGADQVTVMKIAKNASRIYANTVDDVLTILEA